MEKVWAASPYEGWEEASVADYAEDSLVVYFDAEPNVPVRVKRSECLPWYEDALVNTPDIIGLPDLQEATLLWTLRERYAQQAIYTNIGSIVISINPFQNLSIYNEDMIRRYMAQEEGLPPHLFAVAQNAWLNMRDGDGRSQSVVISGESGAGKTEATKVVLKFLTFVASTIGGHSASDLATRILATNPVLEAFGNAKTTRNNNSSRFGKFIKISFEGVTITGAEIDNYLLEKSRIVDQAEGERNYHIFYQLLLGATAQEKQKFQLLDVDKCRYLKGGYIRIKGVDDARDFERVINALLELGFNQEMIEEYFCLLSAILHLGNIEFFEERDNACIDMDDPHVYAVSELLGVPHDLLIKKLTLKLFSIGSPTRGSVREIPMTVNVAMQNRDALAKALYSALFDNVIERINYFLQPTRDSRGTQPTFIGVLDIYGFENFEKNSLEQFCINYANEKLHCQFNDHIFKAEISEYQKEGVRYDSIPIPDNQPTIDMIEKQVITMLVEEGQIPKGSSVDWGRKLTEKLQKNELFFTNPKFRQLRFGIWHYADGVTYDVEGFVERNKDTMSPDVIQLMNESQSPLVQTLFASQAVPPGKVAGSQNKSTLIQKFRNSLQSLIETLSQTNIHYVRCIKPNDQAQPNLFQGKKVLDQLKSNGVIETVKIRKSGYSNHLPHTTFLRRYEVLGIKGVGQIPSFLEYWRIEDAQIGKTKVFLRDQDLKILDREREYAFKQFVLVFQKRIRGNLARRGYFFLLERKRKVVVLQNYVRRWYSAMLLIKLRNEWAVTKNWLVSILQSHVRAYNARMQLTMFYQRRSEDQRRMEEEERRMEEEARRYEEELRREEERRHYQENEEIKLKAPQEDYASPFDESRGTSPRAPPPPEDAWATVKKPIPIQRPLSNPNNNNMRRTTQILLQIEMIKIQPKTDHIELLYDMGIMSWEDIT